MRAWPVLLLSVLGIICAGPALASEKWECTFTDAEFLPPGSTGVARVEINDNVFIWSVATPKLTWPSHREPKFVGTEWVAFSSRVLENNELGVVAVSSESKIDESGQPRVVAQVYIIEKRTGKLRVSGVSVDGADNGMQGQCVAK